MSDASDTREALREMLGPTNFELSQRSGVKPTVNSTFVRSNGVALGVGPLLHSGLQVERSDAVEAHLVAVEQQFLDAANELLHHAGHHVGREDGAVGGYVIAKAFEVDGLQVHHARIPLAV